MEALTITGGLPLSGTVRVSGAKNAALPILAASILAHESVHLSRVPRLRDVDTLSLLLGHLGVEVAYLANGGVSIQTVDPTPIRAEPRLVQRMRASFCVLGPLLARRGRAIVPLPGGCRIGPRPVDLHLTGLAALGADLRIEQGCVIAQARRLRGARINLLGSFGPTVTGTANVMSAAAVARGVTVIEGAAQEPEVVDLGDFLVSLGARIEGLGSSTLIIKGVPELSGGSHPIIPDRIEAGTLLIAAAVTHGCVMVRDVRHDHLQAALTALTQAGCDLKIDDDCITLTSPGELRPLRATALPYPGLPSDLQSQFMALAVVAQGRTSIRDEVFPERFQHLRELRRLGAQIRRRGNTALVDGGYPLQGTEVTACDLRASAALVLAGLCARGQTTVRRIHHLDRGYEALEGKLRSLGASVERVALSTRLRQG